MTRFSQRSLAVLAIWLLSSGFSSAQAPDSLWAKIYGSDDYDRGESLVSTDDAGRQLPSGVYFYKLSTNVQVLSRGMTKVR